MYLFLVTVEKALSLIAKPFVPALPPTIIINEKENKETCWLHSKAIKKKKKVGQHFYPTTDFQTDYWTLYEIKQKIRRMGTHSENMHGLFNISGFL